MFPPSKCTYTYTKNGTNKSTIGHGLMPFLLPEIYFGAARLGHLRLSNFLLLLPSSPYWLPLLCPRFRQQELLPGVSHVKITCGKPDWQFTITSIPKRCFRRQNVPTRTQKMVQINRPLGMDLCLSFCLTWSKQPLLLSITSRKIGKMPSIERQEKSGSVC